MHMTTPVASPCRPSAKVGLARHGGFALTELLVIIAILILFASLLPPTLTRSRFKAQAVACLGNQQQLAAAWAMYSEDHQGGVVNLDTIKNSRGEIPWRYGNTRSMATGTTSQARSLQLLETGYLQGGLFSYAPSVNLLHCPADARCNTPAVTRPTAAPGNFAYCTYSGVAGLNGGQATEIRNQSEIAHPSGRYLFVEENDPRGENQGSWELEPGPLPGFMNTAFIDSVAAWHDNAAIFSWADGHAEIHRWEDPATITYALSMDPNKYYDPPPSIAQSPHDLIFLANGFATQQNP